MEPLTPELEPSAADHSGAASHRLDVRTFEEAFLAVAGGAHRLAVTLTRNAGEAEDLLQEAALAAFRGFASFLPGTNFKAWFYRVLVNRHYQRHRERSCRPATVELDDGELYLFRRTRELGLHDDDRDPAGTLMRKMTAEQVRRAVAALPPEYGVAVSLHFLEELSYEAIAEILGCPLGTVRSRLHRGRRMLQKSLWSIALEAGIVNRLTERKSRR